MQMTHKHDVYFSPYSTEAHNLVMQIADYCNKRGIWYKISESTLGIGIEYGGNVAYVIDADRKTEPTISKMEQVEEPQYDFGEYADRLWKIAYERGKREALEQTEPSCDTCKLKDTTEWCKRQEVCRAYQPKDEPQTDCSWK